MLIASALAGSEILLGFGPGHLLARARAEPDAFLAFRPWLLILAVCWTMWWRGSVRLLPAPLIVFVAAATAGEWTILAMTGRPDTGVMVRSVAASIMLGLGIAAIAAIFLRLLKGRRQAAVAALVFSAGALAVRPPLPSPMHWFEQAIRTAAPLPDGEALPHAVLMTDLPLVWGEGATDSVLDGTAGSPAVYRALKNVAAITPVDAIDEGTLEDVSLLILAQPRALHPVELVRIDDWVRRGGRALVFADPALRWSREMLRHTRLPPAESLVGPLLDHWGIRIDAIRPGFRLISSDHAGWLFGAGRIGVEDAGVLLSRPGGCLVTVEGLIADCRVGAGRALIVADADLLRDAAWAGPGATGLSRAGRMADNNVFAAGAVRALMTSGQIQYSPDAVRWMTVRSGVALSLAGLMFPMLLTLAALGIAIRLRNR